MAFSYKKNKTYIASFASKGNSNPQVYWRQNLSRAKDRGIKVDVKHDYRYHGSHGRPDNHGGHMHGGLHRRHSRHCSGCGYYHYYDYCPHCHSHSYSSWDTDWDTQDWTDGCDCDLCNENCGCNVLQCYDDYVLLKDCHGKIYAVTLDTICCLKMNCNCNCEGDWDKYCPTCR